MPRLSKDWPGLSINGKRKMGPCRSCGQQLDPRNTTFYYSHQLDDEGLCPVGRKREEQQRHLQQQFDNDENIEHNMLDSDDPITDDSEEDHTYQQVCFSGMYLHIPHLSMFPPKIASVQLLSQHLAWSYCILTITPISSFLQPSSEEESSDEFTDCEENDWYEEVESLAESDTDEEDYDDDEEEATSGSLKHLQQNLSQPLYPGALPGVTLAQFIYNLIHLQSSENLTRQQMNKLLSLMQWTLPSDSSIPLTEEMLWKVAGAQTPESISIDVCGFCKDHIFGPTPVKSERDLEEKCPTCSTPRYSKQPNGALLPAHHFYYFGVSKALQQAFNDPDVVTSREEEGARPYDSEGQPWRSSAMTELNASTMDALWTTNQDGTRNYNLSSAVIDLGMDYFGPHKSYRSKASIGAMCLRLQDLPGTMTAKSKYHYTVGVFDKKVPSNLVMRQVVTDLNEQATTGSEIKPARKQQDGTLSYGDSFTLKTYLHLIFGDFPMRGEILNVMGSAKAILACPRCPMNGLTCYDKGTRFMGYTTAVECRQGPHTLDENGEEIDHVFPKFKMGVNDNSRLYSNEEENRRRQQYQQWRQQHPDAAPSAVSKKAGQLGCHGPSELSKLWYIRNVVLIAPIAWFHATMLGVLKDLLAYGTDASAEPEWKIDVKSVRKLEKNLEFIIPADAGRPHHTLEQTGSWLIENCTRFVSEYAPFLFSPLLAMRNGIRTPILGDKMRQAWTLFRGFCMYHFTAETFPVGAVPAQARNHWKTKAQEAREKLLELGRLLEGSMLHELLSINLHQLACFSHLEEVRNGLYRYVNEMFVERFMNKLKRPLSQGGGTNPNNPTYSTAKHELRRQALRAFPFKYRLVDPSSILSQAKRRRKDGTEYDPLQQDHVNTRKVPYSLNGKGTVPTEEELVAIMDGLQKLQEYFSHTEIGVGIRRTLERLDDNEIRLPNESYNQCASRILTPFVHHEGFIKHGFMVTSCTSQLLRKNNSSYAMVSFEREEELLGRASTSQYARSHTVSVEEPHVTRPQFYARVQLYTGEWLRFALCKVYKTKLVDDLLEVTIVPDREDLTYTKDSVHRLVPVLLNTIDTALFGVDRVKSDAGILSSGSGNRARGSYNMYFHPPLSSNSGAVFD